MKKSFLTVCFIASLMAVSLPANVFAEEVTEIVESESSSEETQEPAGAVIPEESQYTYTISNGEAVITGLVDPDMSSEIHLVIPDTIEGYPVVAIGDNAFLKNENIRSLSFEKTTSLREIGISAFSLCTNLEGTLILPGTLIEMGTSENGATFSDTKISKLIVEDGPQPLNISEAAFISCNELKEVFLNNTMAQNDKRVLKAHCGNITKCIQGDPKHKSCGKLFDGTKLTWRYATQNEISYYLEEYKKFYMSYKKAS